MYTYEVGQQQLDFSDYPVEEASSSLPIERIIPPISSQYNRNFAKIALRQRGLEFVGLTPDLQHDVELIKIAIASTKILNPESLPDLFAAIPAP